MEESPKPAKDTEFKGGRVFYRLDGTVEYFDEVAGEMFGASRGVVGQDFKALGQGGLNDLKVRFKDEAALARRARSLMNGKPEDSEFVVVDADGSERVIRVSYDPVVDGEDTVGFVALYQDITDSARPASTPEASPTFELRGAFDALPTPVLVFDSDFSCRMMNVAAQEFLNVRPEPGAQADDLWRQCQVVQVDTVMDAMRRCLQGSPNEATNQLVAGTNGELRLSLEFRPMPTGLICTIHDLGSRWRLAQVELLAKIGRLSTDDFDADALIQSTLDNILERLEIDIAVFALFEGERLRPVAWRGLLLDPSLVADPLVNPYVIQALETQRPSVGDGSEWEGAPMTGDHFIIPMIHRRRVIGTLHLGTLRDEELERLDSDFLLELGSYVASSVEGARRYTQHATERARLEALIKRIPEGVLLFNTRGEVLLSNDAVKDVLEIELKQLNQDRRPYRILDPSGEVMPRGEWPFFRAVRRLAGFVDVPIIIEFSDGRRKHVNVNVLPIAAANGPATSFLGTLEDVTERTVQDRRKDEFLSIASHELRSPLTPLTGFLQLLKRQLERGEPIDETLVTRSSNQVRRLSHLIDVLLDMTRIETNRMILHLETVDLCELVERVVSGWEDHPKGVKVHTEFPEGAVIAKLDQGRIDQVLSNLIDNAVKFTAPGKQVTVRVTTEDAAASVLVSDQGAGIPESEIGRVFDRFYQASRTRRDAKSMGLGLYISQEVIHQHGGKINVTSQEGLGTQVTFTLPLEPH